jgi:hypothetical protein
LYNVTRNVTYDISSMRGRTVYRSVLIYLFQRTRLVSSLGTAYQSFPDLLINRSHADQPFLDLLIIRSYDCENDDQASSAESA